MIRVYDIWYDMISCPSIVSPFALVSLPMSCQWKSQCNCVLHPYSVAALNGNGNSLTHLPLKNKKSFTWRFPKMEVPPVLIHLNRMFHFEPSIIHIFSLGIGSSSPGRGAQILRFAHRVSEAWRTAKGTRPQWLMIPLGNLGGYQSRPAITLRLWVT